MIKYIVNFCFIIFFIALAGCRKEEPITNIFIGDSHIERYDLNYFFPGHNTQNKGISGENINDFRLRIPKYFDVNANCFIEIGINDFTSSYGSESSVNTILSKYNLLISNIRGRFNKIVFISVIPVTKAFASNGKIESIESLFLINRQLKEMLSLENQMIFVDLSNIIYDTEGYLLFKYSNDGVHLNQQGYQLVTNFIRCHVE